MTDGVMGGHRGGMRYPVRIMQLNVQADKSATFLRDKRNLLTDNGSCGHAGLGVLPLGGRMADEAPSAGRQWYVMRDLKRANARHPAYMLLQELGLEVFTPMRWVLAVEHGRRVRRRMPFMQDLLFVHATREGLDPITMRTPTLQYRYSRGDAYRRPMTVRGDDMERFIRAVGSSDDLTYYLPEELTPGMYGRHVRIVGGPLDGYEGRLLTVRGSRVRRLIVELPGFFSAGVRVESEYVRLL